MTKDKFIEDEFFKYKITANKAILIGTRGEVYENHLKIPNYVHFYPVVKIESRAFYETWYIRSVYISKHIKEIGSDSFKKCKYLKEVIFPNDSKLQIINKEAFSHCTRLKAIKIP